MNIKLTENLHVLHRLKDAGGHGLPDPMVTQLASQGLLIDTCLRQIWIQATPNQPVCTPPDNLCSVLTGRNAYSFLLQTISGLNSSIPGETNITGQFKCAWKRWSNMLPTRQSAGIARLMNQLLTDSSHIRRQHLEGTGGSSYGSLVRKLLHAEAGSRILFVGAGKFSRSMLPFFSTHETALWNHKLHKGLQAGSTRARVFTPDESSAAANWADCLILTTPADHDANEQLWFRLSQAHNINKVVHLGRRRAEPGLWKNSAASLLHNLDDVFELRSMQSDLRDLRIAAARRACIQRTYETDAPVLLPVTSVLQGA
jgi:glutamyl-tRNA reductase